MSYYEFVESFFEPNPGIQLPWSPGAEENQYCCAATLHTVPSAAENSHLTPMRARLCCWPSESFYGTEELCGAAWAWSTMLNSTRQWEWRAGSVNAKRDVSKHKVIKYSYQGTEENLWELDRQTKSGQLSWLFYNWWGTFTLSGSIQPPVK